MTTIPWDDLKTGLSALSKRIKKSSAINVNAASLRRDARGFVQLYFREVRPELESLGIDAANVDAPFHALLRLSAKPNAKTSYTRLLRDLSKALEAKEPERELSLGRQQERYDGARATSATDDRIIETLASIVSAAALSYQQALLDLADAHRLSYRGTANELRETLRETVDHFAPDAAVVAAPGFKPERDQKGPTMKQKVRFILSSRQQSDATIDSSANAASVVDELTATFTRAVSTRSSRSTHTPTSRDEVGRIKQYVQIVLCEILEIPAP